MPTLGTPPPENTKRKRIYDNLVSERKNVEGTWDLIEQFVAPFRTRFFEDTLTEGSVNWRKRELMDSTAVNAAPNLAASMHAGITNPQMQWFDTRFRRSSLNDNTEAKQWIEGAGKEVFMTLQESNFNVQVNEAYYDLTTIGTTVVIEEVEETASGDLAGLDFATIPTQEAVFERDSKGNLIALYRKLNWNPAKLLNKFSKETVPESVIKKAENPTGRSEEMAVLFCVYKREDTPDLPEDSKVIAPKNRPFGFKYFLYDSCESLGDEGGYYEMPAFAPRWAKVTGSAWGYSPAMLCLSDVLSLNELIKIDHMARAKAADPPIITTRRGVFGNLDVSAGGVNVVMNKDSISYLESAARFEEIRSGVNDLRRSIDRTFMIDQLELKESPAMTATEVMARMQLMQRLLGPTHGRIESEFLDPLISRTFNILHRYGKLPEAPAGLDMNSAYIDIEYLGATARAQKLDQVTAMERWSAGITANSQTYPEVRFVMNAVQFTKEHATYLGVPSVVMNSDDIIKKKTTQFEKQQENAAKAAEMQQGGEAAKSVGEGAAALQEGGVDGEAIAEAA